jgi:hypothetical protein
VFQFTGKRQKVNACAFAKRLGLDLNKFVRTNGHIPGDIGYSNRKDGIGVGMAFERGRTITYFAPEDVYKQFICK